MTPRCDRTGIAAALHEGDGKHNPVQVGEHHIV